MLEKFARQLPQMIEELALAIGEMPNGEEGRGGPTALRLAHTLRGAAANLAIAGTRQSAAQLEHLLRAESPGPEELTAGLERLRSDAGVFVGALPVALEQLANYAAVGAAQTVAGTAWAGGAERDAQAGSGVAKEGKSDANSDCGR